MRRLMWFTIGFALMCAIGAYFPVGIWILAFLLPFGAGAVLLKKAGKGRIWCSIGVVILTGACLGSLWCFALEFWYIRPARIYDNTEVTAVVTLSDYDKQTDFGSVTDGRITLEGRRYKVRVYTDGSEPHAPGDTLEGSFKIRLTTAGGAKESVYYQGEGVFLIAYARHVKHSPGTEESFRYFPVRLRRWITALLQSTFPEDTLGFAEALLLGDDTGIDYKTDTALKISGIRHVIAVSGLHVSILFSFVYMLAGKRRWLTAVFGVPVLFLFAAAAGFTPSVLRAVLMQTLMILAMLLDREYDPPTSLAFAVLIMLAMNPLSILSVSLQLSCGCIVGVFLLSERIGSFLLGEKGGKGRSLKGKLIRAFAGSVSVSVSTMVVTAPLSAMYFGTVSIVGVLTNLLTLWAVTLSFYGIIAVCGLGAVFLPAGKVLAWGVSWLIRYVTATAGVLSKFPLAAVYTNSIYIVFWLGFVYVLILVFLSGDRKRGGLAVLCIIGSLLLSVGFTWGESRLENYRVTVLDVGQGQSVLVQSRGSCYLIDCGGSVDTKAADAAAQALLSQGIYRLDGLILTHYDEDHAAGAELLLTRIKADALYLPDIDRENPIRTRLASGYPEQICWVTEENRLNTQTSRVTLFPGKNTGNDNESCLCVLFQTENCDILIIGDRNSAGERYLLEQTVLPELEILIAGHHGAATSTSLELLAATRPKCAVISVGEGNSYGHPHKDTLRRLEIFGCAVYRTDLMGNIVFRG